MFNLDNLQSTLGTLAGAAQEHLSGTDLGSLANAPLKDLVTDSFLQGNTSLSSIAELLKLAGIEDLGDIQNISTDKLNSLVQSFSNFEGWQSLLIEAGKQLLAKKLNA